MLHIILDNDRIIALEGFYASDLESIYEQEYMAICGPPPKMSQEMLALPPGSWRKLQFRKYTEEHQKWQDNRLRAIRQISGSTQENKLSEGKYFANWLTHKHGFKIKDHIVYNYEDIDE